MILNTQAKFLLLAQHSEKGRLIIPEMHINYGLVGAVLLEMSLDEQIKIEEDKVILMKDVKSEDPIISEIIQEISLSNKARKIQYWVSRLARKSHKYKWSILSDLAKHKLIRIEKKKFLGLISYRKSYLIESSMRNNLIHELKNCILFKEDLKDDNVLMLGLIEACKMHKIISSDKEELKKLKKELKERIKESPVANTVDKTIKQIQAALFVVTIAATTSSN